MQKFTLYVQESTNEKICRENFMSEVTLSNEFLRMAGPFLVQVCMTQGLRVS